MDQTTSSTASRLVSSASPGGSAASPSATSGAKATDGASTSASSGAKAEGTRDDAAAGGVSAYLEEARALGRRAEISLLKNPYSTLGAVAAAGFFAGSVFGSRLGQLALAAGVGYSLARVFPEPSAIGRKLSSG